MGSYYQAIQNFKKTIKSKTQLTGFSVRRSPNRGRKSFEDNQLHRIDLKTCLLLLNIPIVAVKIGCILVIIETSKTDNWFRFPSRLYLYQITELKK